MGSRKQPTSIPKLEEQESKCIVVGSEDHPIALDSCSSNPSERNTITKEGPNLSVNEQKADPLLNKSWYRTSWPRGSKPSTKTTPRNEISSNTTNSTDDGISTSAEPVRKKPKLNPADLPSSPPPYLSCNIETFSRSLPLVAETTKINIVSQASERFVRGALGISKSQYDNAALFEPRSERNFSSAEEREQNDHKTNDADNATSKKPSLVSFKSDDKQTSSIKSRGETVGWLRWFSNAADVYENVNINNQKNSSKKPSDAQSEVSEQSPTPNLETALNTVPMDQIPRSWIGSWRNPIFPLRADRSESTVEAPTSIATEPQTSKIAHERDSEIPESSPSKEIQPPNPSTSATSKPVGWAFWPREKPKDGNSDLKQDSKETHSTSISDASFDRAAIENGVHKFGKREKPKILDTSSKTTSSDVSANSVMSGKEPPILTTNPRSGIEDPSSFQSKPDPANLLLPLLKHTYRVNDRLGLIQRLNHLLQSQRISDVKHVNLQEPGIVKRALAIGVHGYFPAPLVRSILGQPTGTSIKFANSAASAIERWGQARGYSCEVEKVALEGEGKIAQRVDLLWKLLLNWIDKIQKADFVMVACHSQGVPVAVMLVAKLIALGCVNQSRIGICALAGINLGPFVDYKSRWIAGSAGELFEFALSGSQVTKDYEAALNAVLTHGGRVIYIGSIDDQLVSLESSTFGTVSHPYIYRAVFVDGRIHAPDFLTHLVGFALKLRNLGISDHGLIRELSSPLAGSLYSGEGHSRIHEDNAVYDLAVEFALETTSMENTSLRIHRAATQSSQNPYILPFAMRGLLEEKLVRTELRDETLELLRQFDDWKPSSKVLKDVKFRLEGVRSKLE